MKAIIYRLHLLEPVLIAQAGAGEENSAVGLPYIPGSAVRGALAARWLAKHPGADLAIDTAGRTDFLDGTSCYLNAYPEYDGERTLPTPASWFTEKDLAGDRRAIIYDLATGPDPELGLLKAPQGGRFCRLTRHEPLEAWEQAENRAVLVGSARYEQIHIALEDVNRRGEGNLVFRYDALASGQSFIGAVIAPESHDLSEIRDLLTAGDLFLGSAHLAGYGRVAVQVLEEVPSDWREYVADNPASDKRVVVTLLSQVILRGANGQVGWDGGRALAAALGCGDGAELLAGFGKAEMAGAYNRKWSLPTPQDWALAAGSVFIFATQTVDQDRLRAALDHGVGERRAEGFGRVAVNWQVAPQVNQDVPVAPDSAAPVLSPESQRQARAMAQRRLRLVLDRELTRQVTADAQRLRNPPEKAQISAIRQAALAGMTQKDMKPLLSHLDHLKDAGRQQLERCRVGNQPLLEWLRARANTLDVKEQLMGTQALPTVAGQTVALDREVRVEYTARLIDGVMRTTARGKREVRR